MLTRGGRLTLLRPSTHGTVLPRPWKNSAANHRPCETLSRTFR